MSIFGRLTLNPSNKESDSDLKPIPRESDGPLFSEPWEAQALAIARGLVDAGLVTRADRKSVV